MSQVALKENDRKPLGADLSAAFPFHHAQKWEIALTCLTGRCLSSSGGQFVEGSEPYNIRADLEPASSSAWKIAFTGSAAVEELPKT